MKPWYKPWEWDEPYNTGSAFALAVVVAAILLLIVARPAAAYHANPGDPHWPTTTVQVNGGSCGYKPECRWLKIIDRTGYGTTWQTTTLPNALVALSAATGYRFNFTIVRGTRFDLWTIAPWETEPCDGPCEGIYHDAEAEALTPTGAVFVGHNGYGSTTVACDDPSVDPDGTYPYKGPQPYCGEVSDTIRHVVKAVIGAGSTMADANNTFRHEMGHALGLAHHTCLDGVTVMCGDGTTLNFDAHDKAELGRIYSHVE